MAGTEQRKFNLGGKNVAECLALDCSIFLFSHEDLVWHWKLPKRTECTESIYCKGNQRLKFLRCLWNSQHYQWDGCTADVLWAVIQVKMQLLFISFSDMYLFVLFLKIGKCLVLSFWIWVSPSPDCCSYSTLYQDRHATASGRSSTNQAILSFPTFLSLSYSWECLSSPVPQLCRLFLALAAPAFSRVLKKNAFHLKACLGSSQLGSWSNKI